MQIQADSPEHYIGRLPDDRKAIIETLRKQILQNLPSGFAELMSYGMISYVVPHSVYPKGYRTDPKQPLPFISIASQKKHVAVYHMGLYSNKELLGWFTAEYPKYVSTKLDMGKSCIRFKNAKKIPFELIGELASKMTVAEWIEIYEAAIG